MNKYSSSILRSSLALLILLSAQSQRASAAPIYWDANTAGAGMAGGATYAAGGTWDTSSFWTTDVSGTTGPWQAYGTAGSGSTDVVFQLSPSVGSPSSATINVASAITVNSITLGSQTVSTISPGRWSFTGATINLGAGGISEYNTLSGKSNGGATNFANTINLTASQTWTANLGNATNQLTFSGNINGTASTGTITTLTLAGNTAGAASSGIQFSTGIMSDGGNGGSLGITVNTTQAAALSGVATLTQPLDQLNGTANTFSGPLQVLSGGLSFNSVTTIDSGAASSLGEAFSALGTSYTNIVLGSGTNNVQLVYAGTTNSTTDRVLNLAGTTGQVVLGNTNTLTTGAITYTSNISNTGAGAKQLVLTGANTGTNTISGIISDSTGGGNLTLIKGGVGQWILSGSNTFSGGLTVAAGTLSLNGNGSSFTGTITLTGGTLSVGANDNLGQNVSTNPILIQGGNLLLGADTNVGSNQSITISAAGGGIGVAYTPTTFPTLTNIAGGTVVFGINYAGTGGIGSVTGINNLFTGSTSTFLGSFAGGTGTGTFTGSSLTAGTLAGSGSTHTYRLGGGGGTITIQNNILTGTGNNLLVGGTGGGLVILPNVSSTFDGSTTIQNGTLRFPSAAALGTSTGSIVVGSTTNVVGLDYSGSGETFTRQLNIASTTGDVTLSNSGSGNIVYSATPVFTTGAKTLLLGNTTDSFGGTLGTLTTAPSAIGSTSLMTGNNTALQKQGLTNSTWTLTGTDTYTGNTVINGGVLQIPTGDLASSYISLNGSLNNAAGTTSYGVLQTSGTFTRLLSSTSGSLNLSWGASSGFAAKGGPLTLNLSSGAQLVWGTTAFLATGGTSPMVFGSTTADSQVILANAIDFGAGVSNGFNRSIDVEGSAATITGSNVNFGVSGNSALLSGTISSTTALGNNGFVKLGSGTLIISGSNTYSGGTVINAGTIIAGNNAFLSASGTTTTAGAFGDGHTQGANAGTQLVTLGGANYNLTGGTGDGTTGTNSSPSLLIGGAYTIAIPVTVGNFATTGTYSIGGSTDNNATFSGPITLNRSLSVTQVTTTGTNALNITGTITGLQNTSKVLTFNNVGAVNDTGSIVNGTGSITLVKTNVGVTTLAGTNTYTGTTNINAGTLIVNGSLAAGSTVTVGNNTAVAKLAGTGTINGALVTSTTGANVAHVAPGATAAPGVVGTLTIGSLGFTVGDGTAFDFDLANSLTSGSGVNDLIAMGGGTLTFSGTTTFNFNALTSLSTAGNYTLISGAGSIANFNAANFNATGTGSLTAVFTNTGSALQVSFSSGVVVSPTVAYFNGVGSDLNNAANLDTSVSSGTATSSTVTGTTNVFFSANRNTVTAASATAALPVNSLNFGVGSGTNSGITVSGTSAITINAAGVNGNTAGSGITTTGTGSNTISAPLVLGASQTWTVASGGTLTVSGTVSGSGTALTKSGAGKLVLSGSNTYDGGTTLAAGTMVAANSTTTSAGAIVNGPFGKGTLTLNGGTTLQDNGTAITLANSLSLGGTITLSSTGAGSLTFDGTTLTAPATVTLTSDTTLNVLNTTTIVDNITGNFVLTKIGAGTLNLTGTTTSTAATTVTTGTLSIAKGNSIGSGAISLANATTLQYTGANGTVGQNITVTSGSATINNSGSNVLTLSGTLNKNGTTLNISGGLNVITGQIVGSSANSDVNYINHTTTGLTNTSTYNGPTTISGTSTLLTGVNNALPVTTFTDLTMGASSDVATSVNTLDLLGTSQTVASLTSTGTGTNQIISSNGNASTPTIGAGASTGTGTLTVNVTSGTSTYGGLLGDSNLSRNANNFSLTKSGTGTLALTRSTGNTYTGGTTISAGTLKVSNTSGSATGSGAFNLGSLGIVTGTGTIASSSNTITGNVTPGNGGGDTTSVLTMTATGTTTFTNASLTFNLGTGANLGQSTSLAFGSTASVLFGTSGTSLTLNLASGPIVPDTTQYVLFTSTSSTNPFSDLVTDGNGHILNFGSLIINSSQPNGYYANSYLKLITLGGGAGFNIDVEVVPEPGTWALMLGGLAMLVVCQRARRKNS